MFCHSTASLSIINRLSTSALAVFQGCVIWCSLFIWSQYMQMQQSSLLYFHALQLRTTPFLPQWLPRVRCPQLSPASPPADAASAASAASTTSPLATPSLHIAHPPCQPTHPVSRGPPLYRHPPMAYSRLPGGRAREVARERGNHVGGVDAVLGVRAPARRWTRAAQCWSGGGLVAKVDEDGLQHGRDGHDMLNDEAAVDGAQADDDDADEAKEADGVRRVDVGRRGQQERQCGPVAGEDGG